MLLKKYVNDKISFQKLINIFISFFIVFSEIAKTEKKVMKGKNKDDNPTRIAVVNPD